jgi:hypothetical protein
MIRMSGFLKFDRLKPGIFARWLVEMSGTAKAALGAEFQLLGLAREKCPMAKIDRVRELVQGPLSQDYVTQKAQEGWKLTALEWEREIEETPRLSEDVPYGLQVGPDCSHLEENASEKQALILMMDLIVQDAPLSLVAEELNRKGFRRSPSGSPPRTTCGTAGRPSCLSPAPPRNRECVDMIIFNGSAATL